MTIARIWRGATRAHDSDRYVEYLKETGVADYLATPGNRGVEILRRDDGDRTLFTIVSLWDSLDAIRGFAGEDVELAKYYPEDDPYLLERDPTVVHYTVASD